MYSPTIFVRKNKRGEKKMGFTDFEYNGQRLSEYGCIICVINGSTGAETIDVGNKVKFNTINNQSRNNSNRFKLYQSTYEEYFTKTFEICKFDCNNQNDKYFTDDEVRRIIRWLNQKTFHKFKMIYSDGQYSNIYYNGSFNVQLIVLGEKVIGMSLSFESDSPYGYYEPISYYMDFSNTSNEYVVYDSSDESGYIYPKDVKFEILENGNLTVCNSLDDSKVVINNCTTGEVITFNADTKTIYSNKRDSTIQNYFNYNFLKVVNKSDEFNSEEDYAKNVYTANLKCIISFSYSPIAKIGVI